MCPQCHRIPLEDYIWWVYQCQHGANPSEAKVCRAHAPPHGACENLVCALVVLALRGPAGADQAQNHE